VYTARISKIEWSSSVQSQVREVWWTKNTHRTIPPRTHAVRITSGGPCIRANEGYGVRPAPDHSSSSSALLHVMVELELAGNWGRDTNPALSVSASECNISRYWIRDGWTHPLSRIVPAHCIPSDAALHDFSVQESHVSLSPWQLASSVGVCVNKLRSEMRVGWEKQMMCEDPKGSDHRKWYPKWPVGSLFVSQCTYVFEIATDIKISKWLVSVVKYHLLPSVSVKCSLWDMIQRLCLWFGIEQCFVQKHGVDMVIQQPQSAKPFSLSVDKINFNMDYNSAQYKWWSGPRGMSFPLPKNLHRLSHHIFILKRCVEQL
jgi:hypothetical protein